MRVRWAVISVLFIAAAVAVFSLCREAGGAGDMLIGMARRVCFGGLYGLGFWCVSMLIPKRTAVAPKLAVRPSQPPLPPIPTFEIFPGPSGPGQYRVRGVDMDSNYEITEVVFADSPSAAQLKVELKGVHVAAVERAA